MLELGRCDMAEPLFNIVVEECRCPRCGAEGWHPADLGRPILERRVLVRGFKVHDGVKWWSQCLVCAGAYEPGSLEETPGSFDREMGWF